LTKLKPNERSPQDNAVPAMPFVEGKVKKPNGFLSELREWLLSLGLSLFQSQFGQEFENLRALEIEASLSSGILQNPGEVCIILR